MIYFNLYEKITFYRENRIIGKISIMHSINSIEEDKAEVIQIDSLINKFDELPSPLLLNQPLTTKEKNIRLGVEFFKSLSFSQIKQFTLKIRSSNLELNQKFILIFHEYLLQKPIDFVEEFFSDKLIFKKLFIEFSTISLKYTDLDKLLFIPKIKLSLLSKNLSSFSSPEQLERFLKDCNIHLYKLIHNPECAKIILSHPILASLLTEPEWQETQHFLKLPEYKESAYLLNFPHSKEIFVRRNLKYLSTDLKQAISHTVEFLKCSKLHPDSSQFIKLIDFLTIQLKDIEKCNDLLQMLTAENNRVNMANN